MSPKPSKKLVLSRETVRELTESQLGLAAGGSDGDPVPLSRLGCGSSRPTMICNTNPPCYHC
jgi:hypothetical protein